MDAVAEYLALRRSGPRWQAFYSMFETRPVGRPAHFGVHQHFCMLRGADAIGRAHRAQARRQDRRSTPDGKFYLKCEEECLGGVQQRADDDDRPRLLRDLTPEKVDRCSTLEVSGACPAK